MNRKGLIHHAPFLAVLALASVLLSWRLGAVYLWQDEAATAVLAERMVKYGKPLAWDGRNIITMDSFADEDVRTVGVRTGSAEVALRYLVARHDFRPDYAWVGQPWGQFVAAAAGLTVFGHNTVAARLPFAIAALATVILLYLLAVRLLDDRLIATLAAALLASNAYWILHSRQCRYYALSSLALVATFSAFDRWQRGARWGAAIFVAVGWLYFQCDFGSFIPSMAILGLVALASRRRRWTEVVAAFAALGAAVAPFVWYYGLLERVRNPIFGWRERFTWMVFSTDAFVASFVVVAAAAALLWTTRRSVPTEARVVLWSIVALIVVMPIWVTFVAPAPFLRYVIHLAPVASLLVAWTIVRSADLVATRAGRPWLRPAFIAPVALAFAVTGFFSAPVTAALIPGALRYRTLLRTELAHLVAEVFVQRRDPNRDVIEAIAPSLRDGDEILVNYEDIPFMFYTQARIRGGVAAFRVEDLEKPPRFAVLRHSVPFVHWPVFARETSRYEWRQVPVLAPDVPFGNNPDPTAPPFASGYASVEVGERVGP